MVLVVTLDHNERIELLQLSVKTHQLAFGTAQLRVHLLGISFDGGGSAEVLGSLFDLQLFADLPADPLPVLIQALLHTGVREVRVLVQAELLQYRQPARIGLKSERRPTDSVSPDATPTTKSQRATRRRRCNAPSYIIVK